LIPLNGVCATIAFLTVGFGIVFGIAKLFSYHHYTVLWCLFWGFISIFLYQFINYLSVIFYFIFTVFLINFGFLHLDHAYSGIDFSLTGNSMYPGALVCTFSDISNDKCSIQLNAWFGRWGVGFGIVVGLLLTIIFVFIMLVYEVGRDKERRRG
jgi:hypothetical protein